MWNLEETNKARLLILGRLMLSNQKLVLQMPNLSLKLIQLKWPLRRLMVIIIRALLEKSCSSKENLFSISEALKMLKCQSLLRTFAEFLISQVPPEDGGSEPIILSEAECSEVRVSDARCSEAYDSELVQLLNHNQLKQ